MDKITRQVRIEHWTQIMNECLNSGMNNEYSCAEEPFHPDYSGNTYGSHPGHAGSDSPAEYKHGAPDRADR